MCGLLAAGCGPKRRPSRFPSSTWTDRVGPLTVSYHDPQEQPIPLQPERRAEVLRRAILTLDAYRAAYGWQPEALHVRVYPALERGLPGCGPGSSGCAFAGGPVSVGGSLSALFHELHHYHRWALGDPDWTQHSAAHWQPVNEWRPPW